MYDMKGVSLNKMISAVFRERLIRIRPWAVILKYHSIFEDGMRITQIKCVHFKVPFYPL